jgi:hypothetical protein
MPIIRLTSKSRIFILRRDEKDRRIFSSSPNISIATPYTGACHDEKKTSFEFCGSRLDFFARGRIAF